MFRSARSRSHAEPEPWRISLSSESPKKFFRAIEEAFVQRSVFVAAESGKFFELLALLAVQAARHFDQQTREEIAAIAAVDVDNAFAAQLEDLTALGSRRAP